MSLPGHSLYPEIPQHFRYVQKKWRVRQRQPNLGRVYTIHPRDRECFFLRILLHNVRGPTSFEDIRTVDGVVCQMFKEACERLGLLEADDHWRVTLEEAVSTMMPKVTRALFAVMVSSCELSTPLDLWTAFKEPMSEDFLYQARLTEPAAVFSDRITNQALICIEDQVMNATNRPLTQFGLPSPDRSLVTGNRIMMREMSYDSEEMTEIITTRQNSLTDEQAQAVEAVMGAVNSGNSGFFFLDAPGTNVYIYSFLLL